MNNQLTFLELWNISLDLYNFSCSERIFPFSIDLAFFLSFSPFSKFLTTFSYLSCRLLSTFCR